MKVNQVPVEQTSESLTKAERLHVKQLSKDPDRFCELLTVVGIIIIFATVMNCSSVNSAELINLPKLIALFGGLLTIFGVFTDSETYKNMVIARRAKLPYCLTEQSAYESLLCLINPDGKCELFIRSGKLFIVDKSILNRGYKVIQFSFLNQTLSMSSETTHHKSGKIIKIIVNANLEIEQVKILLNNSSLCSNLLSNLGRYGYLNHSSLVSIIKYIIESELRDVLLSSSFNAKADIEAVKSEAWIKAMDVIYTSFTHGEVKEAFDKIIPAELVGKIKIKNLSVNCLPEFVL